MESRKFKIPDTFVLIFSIIILAAIATWIVPGGKFQRETVERDGMKREAVVKDSFKYEKNNPQHVEVFAAPLQGFVRMSEIIAFVIFVGGAFFIFLKTGAINAAISAVVRRMQGKEKLIIVFVMVVFSFFGAFFGMCEEAMPFVLMFVPLALALGYDSITGVCLSFLAAGVGFATAFFNPFTVQIAQKFAEIPPISGWEYRVILWVLITTFTIIWVVRYAEKVKKNPELSLTYEADKIRRQELEKETRDVGEFNRKHGAVLLVLFLGIVALFYGVIELHWYMTELGCTVYCDGNYRWSCRRPECRSGGQGLCGRSEGYDRRCTGDRLCRGDSCDP